MHRLEVLAGHIAPTYWGRSAAEAAAYRAELLRCREAIRAFILEENCGPILVRLAWHDSGTFDASVTSWPTCGGANGSIRFEQELKHGANAGLAKGIAFLREFTEAHPTLSWADIIQLASATAIECMGGPKIPVKYGRLDADRCPAEGNLPDAKPPFGTGHPTAAAHLRAIFYRMGFDDREIVALSGAHTLGRCHKTRSGFDGPWTHDPLKWDNSYFKNLTKFEWKPREWEGPLQYADPKNELMMLPTDVALKTDKKFLPHVKEFAKDEASFNKAFKNAMEKLIALGCHASVQPGAAAAAAVADETDRLSRELREHCMHGSLEHAQMCLKRGADPTRLEANSGRSALHNAAFWGHDHIVPWLLTLKVPVNAVDYNGDTALHDAARFGHDKCIDALLGAAGVDVSVVNKEGKTAHDVAVENGKKPRAGLSAGGGCVVS